MLSNFVLSSVIFPFVMSRNVPAMLAREGKANETILSDFLLSDADAEAKSGT